MKGFKFYIAILLSIVMMFAVAACDAAGNGDGEGNGGGGNGGGSTPTLAEIVVAYGSKTDYSREATSISKRSIEFPQDLVDQLLSEGKSQDDIDGYIAAEVYFSKNIKKENRKMSQATAEYLEQTFEYLEGDFELYNEQHYFWKSGVQHFIGENGEDSKILNLSEYDRTKANIHAGWIPSNIASATKSGNNYTVSVVPNEVYLEKLTESAAVVFQEDADIDASVTISVANNAITKISVDAIVEQEIGVYPSAVGGVHGETNPYEDFSMTEKFEISVVIDTKTTASIVIPSEVADVTLESLAASYVAEMFYLNSTFSFPRDEMLNMEGMVFDIKTMQTVDYGAVQKVVVTTLGEEGASDVVSDPMYFSSFGESAYAKMNDAMVASMYANATSYGMNPLSATHASGLSAFIMDNLAEVVVVSAAYDIQADEFSIEIEFSDDETYAPDVIDYAVKLVVNSNTISLSVDVDEALVWEVKSYIDEDANIFANPFVNGVGGFDDYVDILSA